MQRHWLSEDKQLTAITSAVGRQRPQTGQTGHPLPFAKQLQGFDMLPASFREDSLDDTPRRGV